MRERREMDFAMIEGMSHRRWPVHGYLRRLNHPSIFWSTIQGAWSTTFDFYSRIDKRTGSGGYGGRLSSLRLIPFHAVTP